ncbi:O-antigen polymerase [Ruoffia sp. FAM 20858]|uniref:O-antigen polymerase n=1 Tax=Ruoffia sp. FAM 20858 TaxID=3259516 RepID=UPI003883C9DE
MRISKKNMLITIMVLICTILAGIITQMSNNELYHVLSIWIIVIITILVSKFDLLHPYFWFTSFFALYSTAYTIILIQGFQTNIGYTSDNSLLTILALATIIVIIGPPKNSTTYIQSNKTIEISSNDSKINRDLLQKILIVLIVILIACVIVISQIGIQKKSELVSNRYFSFRLATYLVRYITLYVSLYIVSSTKNIKLGSIVIFSGISVLLFTLFTAERDGIFRFILVVVASLFATKRISRKTLPLVIGISGVAVVILSYLKYFFVSGQVRTGFNDNGLIYNFLNSDFAAAGENMQVLLNNPWTNSYFNYSIILNDLLAPFTFVFKSFNVGSWFNDTFYYGSYSRAFTLLGQGYVIGGYIGVILLFIVVSTIVKVLYKRSGINFYWLTTYIYMIATVASSFRGNLSSIIETLIRIPFVGLLGFFMLRLLIVKKRKSTFKINSKIQRDYRLKDSHMEELF